MKITSKGQVTIPAKLRKKLGFTPNTEVAFVPDEDGLRLVKAQRPLTKGEALVEHMRGRGKTGLSTDEIMRLTRGEP